MLIEIDGGVHRLQAVAERDAEKTLLAAREGFRLLRLTNQEIWGSEDAGLSKVRAFLYAPLP
jgi:very-short-patch-repair endonuclease